MKTAISTFSILFLLTVTALAEDLKLANGQIVSGTVSRYDNDGIAFQTPSGGIKYQWRHLSREDAARLQAEGEVVQKQVAMLSDFKKKLEAGEIKIFTPKEIQTSAFSLKGQIILMSPEDGRPQEVAEGQYAITWAYNLKSVLPAELAQKALTSEALFVRVTEPDGYRSVIEVMGNTLKQSGDGIAPGWQE